MTRLDEVWEAVRKVLPLQEAHRGRWELEIEHRGADVSVKVEEHRGTITGRGGTSVVRGLSFIVPEGSDVAMVVRQHLGVLRG